MPEDAGVGRVLLVDDDDTVRRTIAAVLRRAGFQTLEASSAGAALEIATREGPSVVLLDVELGLGASGFDVAEALRQNPTTATVPIVFLTGKAMSSADVERGKQLGISYLFQPVHPEHLVSVIRGAIARRRLK